MKDYIIEVKNGHHHVRMLSDEEMQQYKEAAETIVQFVQNLFDAVKETVENIVENLNAWIKENNIIELLEEYENDKYSTQQSGYSLPADTTGEAGHCDAGTAGD